MPGNIINEYRVFIASPGDVSNERRFVYEVIEDVNDILDSLRGGVASRKLKAIGWEEAYPTGGKPNQKIQEKFPVSTMDIFIGILWKRFGQPPDSFRSDGTEFLSGTEEEIELAFEANRLSVNGRPIIMLYRKEDDPKIRGAEDNSQYGRVLNFFKECEPRGKHPALVQPFFAKDFKNKLRRHLLSAIVDLSVALENQDDPFKQWLQDNKLTDNPFRHYLAEKESDLPYYYVPFQALQNKKILDDLISEANTWIIWGHEGGGKTALRSFLASRCFPFDKHSRIAGIQYGAESFKKALSTNDSLDQVILKVLQDVDAQISNINGQNPSKSGHINENVNVKDIYIFLSKIKDKVLSMGFENIICLIDPIDESLITDLRKEKTLKVIAHLTTLTSNGILFRFFLPQKIQINLSRQHIYFGRCRSLTIEWNEKSLIELIRRRMIFFSLDKLNAYFSIGPLCEPGGSMGRIDQEIVDLANGNPRSVVWLASQLFMTHCQNNPGLLKISRQTWDRVQQEWWTVGRNMILGSAGSKDDFWAMGKEVFFKTMKVDLSKRSKLLLICLINFGDQLCSKDKLIDAAWANENKEGITNAALREAMRRLKIELHEKNGINPDWIKTIHNQGYQLLKPDSNTLKQEDLE